MPFEQKLFFLQREAIMTQSWQESWGNHHTQKPDTSTDFATNCKLFYQETEREKKIGKCLNCKQIKKGVNKKTIKCLWRTHVWICFMMYFLLEFFLQWSKWQFAPTKQLWLDNLITDDGWSIIMSRRKTQFFALLQNIFCTKQGFLSYHICMTTVECQISFLRPWCPAWLLSLT